ncbi:MAG: hypothetical protein LBI02_01880 [Opitutaceae bacterium]|jgi:hypothetical protein|nr:hypothetical protein [Opitutaceae bacterium]
MVHDNQWAYYEAINRSTQNTDCGAFIDFMPGEIRDPLSKHKGETLAGAAKTGQVCDQVILPLKALKSGKKTSFEARESARVEARFHLSRKIILPPPLPGCPSLIRPATPRKNTTCLTKGAPSSPP